MSTWTTPPESPEDSDDESHQNDRDEIIVTNGDVFSEDMEWPPPSEDSYDEIPRPGSDVVVGERLNFTSEKEKETVKPSQSWTNDYNYHQQQPQNLGQPTVLSIPSSSSGAFTETDDKERHWSSITNTNINRGSLESKSVEFDVSVFPHPFNPTTLRGGYSRQAVLETHVKKPQFSPKKRKLLCGWLNSLSIWPQRIDVENLHSSVCSGLLLIKLIRHYEPTVKFKIVHEKVLRMRLALENLEQALGYMMRSKQLNNSRVPSAKDVYHGNMTKIWAFIFELFDAYVVRIWKGGQGPLVWRLLHWYASILLHYDRQLPPVSMTILPTADGKNLKSSNVPEICSRFRTGTDIFCTIYHFLGPVEIDDITNSGMPPIAIDPAKVFFEPKSMEEAQANVQFVFDLLRALGVEVLWDVGDWVGSSDVASEWIGQHDTLFVILQLNLVYEAFKDRESVFGVAASQTATLGEITQQPSGDLRSSTSSTGRILAWDSSTQLPETDRVLQQLNGKLTTAEQQKQQDQVTAAAAANRLLPSGRRPLLSFRTNDSTAILTAPSDMGMLSHQRIRESAPQSREHIPTAAPSTIAIHVSPSHQQHQHQQLSSQISPGGSPSVQTITNNGVTVSISVGSMAEMVVGETTSSSSSPSRQLQQSSSTSPIQQSSSSRSLLSRWKSPTPSHFASSALRTSSSGRFSSVTSSVTSAGTKCDWVQHVSKDVSHNVKLNQARAEALAARQHVNNPPALREKYAQHEIIQHHSSAMLPPTLVSHNTESASMQKVSSPVLLSRQSFPSGSPPKFRSSPSSSSPHVVAAADPMSTHNSYSHTTFSSFPGNIGMGTSSNVVSFSTNGILPMDMEERQLFREIRDKERKIMMFEDDRRRRKSHF